MFFEGLQRDVLSAVRVATGVSAKARRFVVCAVGLRSDNSSDGGVRDLNSPRHSTAPSVGVLAFFSPTRGRHFDALCAVGFASARARSSALCAVGLGSEISSDGGVRPRDGSSLQSLHK